MGRRMIDTLLEIVADMHTRGQLTAVERLVLQARINPPPTKEEIRAAAESLMTRANLAWEKGGVE